MSTSPNAARRGAPTHPLAPMALVFAAVAATACGGTPGPPVGDVPDPAPRTGPASLEVSQALAPPGSEVRLRADGLPPGTSVAVGFGPPDSEYEVVKRVQTDAAGAVATSVRVPGWAERGRPYVFVVDAGPGDTRVVSDPVLAAAAGDRVTIEGRLTDEGVECPAMRDRAGVLYTLARPDLQGMGPGDEVRVTGTVAEVSTCMQGVTLGVQRIERR